jgi:hypothetical protein
MTSGRLRVLGWLAAFVVALAGSEAKALVFAEPNSVNISSTTGNESDVTETPYMRRGSETADRARRAQLHSGGSARTRRSRSISSSAS